MKKKKVISGIREIRKNVLLICNTCADLGERDFILTNCVEQRCINQVETTFQKIEEKLEKDENKFDEKFKSYSDTVMNEMKDFVENASKPTVATRLTHAVEPKPREAASNAIRL